MSPCTAVFAREILYQSASGSGLVKGLVRLAPPNQLLLRYAYACAIGRGGSGVAEPETAKDAGFQMNVGASKTGVL